jgi:hypothetical protein
MHRALAGSLSLFLLSAAASAQVTISLDKSTPIQTRAIPASIAPPWNVKAEPAISSVKLTWNCPGSATAFEIYVTPVRGTQTRVTSVSPQCAPDGTFSQPTTLTRLALASEPVANTAMSFTHGDLQASSDYSYVVRAIHPGGPADAPPVATKTLPLPAPGGFGAVIAGQIATLTWQPVMSARGYEILRKLQGEPAFKSVGTTTPDRTTYTSDALPPGQAHAFQVQAFNGTPSAAAMVLSGKPSAFTAMAQEWTPIVHFTWSGTTGATNLVLARAAASQGPWLDLPTAEVDSNGVNNAQRWYRLTATYPTGTVHSDVVSAIARYPVGVTGLRHQAMPVSHGGGGVKVIWNCERFASHYEVWRAVGTAQSVQVMTPQGAPLRIQASHPTNCPYLPNAQQSIHHSLYFDDTNAAAGGTYHYRVIAHYGGNRPPQVPATRDATYTVTLAP